MLRWQVAFIAVSAYLHLETEPSDTSAKALVATLRKRLSAARDALPQFLRDVQVRMKHCHLRWHSLTG